MKRWMEIVVGGHLDHKEFLLTGMRVVGGGHGQSIWQLKCFKRVGTTVCIYACLWALSTRPHVMRNSWSIKKMDEVGWSPLPRPNNPLLGLMAEPMSEIETHIQKHKLILFSSYRLLDIQEKASFFLKHQFKPIFTRILCPRASRNVSCCKNTVITAVYSQWGLLATITAGKTLSIIKRVRKEMGSEGMQMSGWLCTKFPLEKSRKKENI